MERRASVIVGVLMILAGILFLSFQLVPGLAERINFQLLWPLFIVGLGGVFLLLGLVASPPLAVPGSVVAGVGGILFYQNISGNWGSWAYIWALIPGFVGIGMILMSLREGKSSGVGEGVRLLGISLVMYLAFAAFFGGLGFLGQYWPVLLILLGVVVLVRNLRGQK
mgnify:CR=1 FL=1